MITNTQSGTRIDEIGEDLYRISTPVPPEQMPGGFSFNQYLIVDDSPLLFHTGMRGLFPLVRQAIETIMPLGRLRYIGFSHVEADECGALNDFLEAAPDAVAVCSRVGAMISLGDSALRPARPLGDGEILSLGRHELMWIDAPHVPHNWETGYMFDRTTGTLLCGDLFTHGGHDRDALTTEDILERAETFRKSEGDMGLPASYSHGRPTADVLERLARLEPRLLACMHGSAWSGTGAAAAAMLRGLSARLTEDVVAV